MERHQHKPGNGNILGLSAHIQIGLILSGVGGIAWLITFISNSVDVERRAREAEVSGQTIQRAADMDRIKKDVDVLRREFKEHVELHGHPGVAADITRIEGEITAERQERVGEDNVSKQVRADLERRMQDVERRSEWFLQTRTDIGREISALKESQRLIEQQCNMKKEK